LRALPAHHDNKKRRYAIIQAEDELASIGLLIGAAGTVPGLRDLRPRHLADAGIIASAYFAEIPAVISTFSAAARSTGMPTRTQQADIISAAYASHAIPSTSCCSRRTRTRPSPSPPTALDPPPAADADLRDAPIWTSA